MDKNIKASITVEASFCVPIFFLVLFSLLYEFNILFGINENYAKLYDAADRYAIYSHDTNENNSDKSEYSYEKIRMLTDNIASFLSGKNIISWTDKGGYKVCYMKYKRCEHCLKYSKTVGTYIYITDYGDRYHMSGHCSGIKRNIKKVKKSKVGGMSECNKCMERG